MQNTRIDDHAAAFMRHTVATLHFFCKHQHMQWQLSYNGNYDV